MNSRIAKDTIEWWGVPVSDHIRGGSFTDLVGRMLFNRQPSTPEARMLEAILISMIDHGLAAPSTSACVIAASGSRRMPQAVAAGLMALGDTHGCFLRVAEFIQANKHRPPADVLKDYRIVPGFGHPLHSRDPRVAPLIETAQITGFKGEALNFMLAMGEVLPDGNNRACMNPAGCIPAIVIDMGLSGQAAEALLILSRGVGLCGHAIEEIGKPSFRTLE